MSQSNRCERLKAAHILSPYKEKAMGNTQTQDSKRAYQEKLEAQLKDWDADIEKFKAKTQKAKADTKDKYQKDLKALQTKRKTAGDKLQEFKNYNGDAWEEMKTGVQKSWQDLEDSVKKSTKDR
jgi:hypothetical protein